MNIVLIGFRGAGKTVVGKRLAEQLQRKFVDTDDLIEERSNRSINEIVKFHGWDYFRALEKRIIEEVASQDHLVIAPGGGVVLETENVIALKRNGLIIWLKAKWPVLQKRMERDPQTFSQRPTLTGKGTLEELEEVISYREPFYGRAAEIQLDTSTLDVETVLDTLLSLLRERMGRT
jgi:shikimate kinase